MSDFGDPDELGDDVHDDAPDETEPGLAADGGVPPEDETGLIVEPILASPPTDEAELPWGTSSDAEGAATDPTVSDLPTLGHQLVAHEQNEDLPWTTEIAPDDEAIAAIDRGLSVVSFSGTPGRPEEVEALIDQTLSRLGFDR